MTHPIIKTDNYLLVLSDEEIKEGNLIYEADTDTINTAGKDYHNFTETDAKIISHLPLNGAPVLEGVDLLPAFDGRDDDDLDRLSTKSADDYYLDYRLEWKARKYGFIDGYNKAREKYNLTLNKLIDMYIEKTGYGMDMWSKEENETMSTIADIIESLQQPKLPITFECEMEEGLINQQTKINDWGLRPKTTTVNGHTVWVGKYIY